MNRPMSKPTPALLRNVPLFSDLDERDLESLAEEFNERRFSAGDKIALEGEGGLMFFVVESGELSVEVHGEPVSTMGPGAVVRRDRPHRPAADARRPSPRRPK